MALVEFKQGEEIAKVSKDPVDKEGICWALSMHWLKLSLSGKSDSQQARINSLRELVADAIGLQRHYSALFARADVPEEYTNPGAIKIAAMVQFLGARMGLEIDRRERTKVMMSSSARGERIPDIAERLRTGGTGHILHFQSKDSGHAMATRARSSGFWHTFGNATFLFDPNEGELDMNKDAVIRFLRNYMKNQGSELLVIVKVKLSS